LKQQNDVSLSIFTARYFSINSKFRMMAKKSNK